MTQSKTPQSDQKSKGLTDLLDQAPSDSKAFARLLTRIDQIGLQSLTEPRLLNPSGAAFRLGLTGPPGAGKSTLVNQFLASLKTLQPQLKIGVLAVDPSSPFSKGAILGDRIRYSDHFLEPHIFIRSLGTRGSLGGLSGSAYLMLRAFDACGFDIVLIETVGIGQSELDILHVADKIGLVLVPESGDSIQAMKAGVSEIADFVIVNKADRPGATSLVRELEAAYHLDENPPQIFQTVATQATGMEPLVQYARDCMKHSQLQKRWQNAEQLKEEAKALLRVDFESKVASWVQDVDSPESFLSVLLRQSQRP